jgi:hypothetical protein
MSYRFFYHFNKPMTQKTGKVFWSIHYRQTCYYVNNIECLVPTNTKENPRQPKAVVQGFCKEILIQDGTAIIT